MIRITGRFNLLTTDAAAVDAAFDKIMDVLIDDASILEPTLSVDLAEGYMLVELLVDTALGIEASQTAMRAIAPAFEAAGVDVHGDTRVLLHNDLIERERLQLTSERIPVAV